MKIDRSNYEIWLIDWLDGNLSDLQAEKLLLFLDENPDLKEEYKELNSISLRPSVKSFPRKKLLKKSTSDLSLSQFEYLCVAYLENDLSDEQQAELKEITGQDPEKKRTFDLIQKTKLTPADISYKYKSHLLKRTNKQILIRMSVIGLSAAATIALIIMTYLIIPRKLPDNITNTAENIVVDTIVRQPSIDTEPVLEVSDLEPEVPEIINDNLLAKVPENTAILSQEDTTIALTPDELLARNPDNQEIIIRKVSFDTEIVLKTDILSNMLVPSNITLDFESDDDRSNVSRFIARTFREKILKDEITPDSPLKGYEIAEVGIAGLNKLLGWEMALAKNNDENGELKSVYFSSKILKFNAPVKKSVPVP